MGRTSSVLIAGVAILGLVSLGTSAIHAVTPSQIYIQPASGSGYELTSYEVQANAGETFGLVNNTPYVAAVDNSTGSVTINGTLCSVNACTIPHMTTAGNNVIVSVNSPGTVSVSFVAGSAQVFTLTVVSGVSPQDPALVYPTANLDTNGGACAGDLQFIKRNGRNDSFTAPTGASCDRDGYDLVGWARSSEALVGEFRSGSVVPIGDESFTLYAVWSPQGVLIRYDAAVSTADPCLSDGSNTAVRQSIEIEPETGRLATSAPCAPPNMILAGWRNAGNGRAFGLGESVQNLGVSRGMRVTLNAIWTVTYGILVTPSSIEIDAGASTVISVQALLNNSPVAAATVSLVASGPVLFADGSRSITVVTRANGTVAVPVTSIEGGQATITAAYGDKTSSTNITLRPLDLRSISIVGERTIVSGRAGIKVEGIASGFPPGDVVVPWFRFPGETTYSQGSARPPVDSNGEFMWQRKTGKKIYVYFTNESGTVKSNRTIIPAA